MLDSIIKSLFMMVPMALSMAVYYKIDKECSITDKISSKIKVDKKWQPVLVICCSFAFIIIFSIIIGYIINIPENLFLIFNGFIMGIGLGFALKLQNENK
ncbi:hypothetical protein KPL39_14135 [Clostridium gasigenes]|uniref:hypothetical protein n=1 Tax=Clostridium gasigenes TaxID=94869 RepID=UPI001C0BAF34|nr:hypothetical protein [Clostridium gasigenes]MBU3137405.1 hypothetical protein [Clostridium gasigenes]